MKILNSHTTNNRCIWNITTSRCDLKDDEQSRTLLVTKFQIKKRDKIYIMHITLLNYELTLLPDYFDVINNYCKISTSFCN